MAIKEDVRRLVRQFGFEVLRVPKGAGSRTDEYAPVIPYATYSPWNKDSSFQKAYASIKENTLVDMYRCYELWTLVGQSAKLDSGSIIEIGVWRGGTGALMASQARNVGITETVFLCDTFTGVVKAGPMDSSYKGGEHADTTKGIVEDLVFKRLGLDNVAILEGIFPDETGQQIEGLKFRLCHIDVDVYESAKGVIDWIWDRMVPGGIVVYDDFGFAGCGGIAEDVEEQGRGHDPLVVHNLNGHAVVLKL